MRIHAKNFKHESHRNGISGEAFEVAIFTDGEGRRMLAVDFGKDADEKLGAVAVAVFDLGKLAEEDILFGSNSWRGDEYAKSLRTMLAVEPSEHEKAYPNIRQRSEDQEREGM